MQSRRKYNHFFRTAAFYELNRTNTESEQPYTDLGVAPPLLKAFSGDAGYRGTAVDFVVNGLGLALHISEKIEGKWAVLPKRWVIERTFPWLGNFRRLSEDFEILPATAEKIIYHRHDENNTCKMRLMFYQTTS